MTIKLILSLLPRALLTRVSLLQALHGRQIGIEQLLTIGLAEDHQTLNQEVEQPLEQELLEHTNQSERILSVKFAFVGAVVIP